MDNKPYPPSNELRASEHDFWSRLVSLDEQIYAYEDEVLQGLARSLIPVERLRVEAMKQCGAVEVDDKSRDYLLRELLRWFKYEFFSWTDKPKCEKCQGTTTYFAHLDPSSDEYRYGARRVEGYRCETCSAITRFPRYNDPGKLLETRTGRCGEWANCFALCCRAMNFETRYVLDWTDHVWTEVYSAFQRRWLHCDSCENACDTPLIYEEGWGKKLTYVVAFSKDEIIDVTWRYSKKHRDVWKRRLSCRESILIGFIDKLNAKRRQNISNERRKVMDERGVIECVELVFPRLDVKEDETGGRTSGDLNWRRERGETGREKTAENNKKKQSFIFRLTPEEIEKRSFVLEYYSSVDEYRRPDAAATNALVPNWLSCVYEADDVFRKVEHDWKMVYLARNEKASVGTISWKFDFSSDALDIDHVIVKVDRKTFEDGSVHVLLCQDDACFLINDKELKITDLNSNSFEIKITLSGGKGDCAWQHAQLFRARSDDSSVASFVVIAKFRTKS